MKKNYRPKIKEIPTPPLIKAMLEPDAKTYEMEGLRIIIGTVDGKYHMSVSHEHRYPTWDEMTYLRYALIPNERTMAMIMPPKEEYVNLHTNCFHIWEIEGDSRYETRPSLR